MHTSLYTSWEVFEVKMTNYVKKPMELNAHLTGWEDRVKTFRDEVIQLNENLSKATSEMTIMESQVIQHAKVAEEAASSGILNSSSL